MADIPSPSNALRCGRLPSEPSVTIQTYPSEPVSMAIDVKTGRPQSIPRWVWPQVFELHNQGLGYRRVAVALASLQVWTTKSLS